MYKQNKINKMIFQSCDWLEKKIKYLRGQNYHNKSSKKEVAILDDIFSIKPRLAIDIGGNIGEYTKNLCDKYPSIEVHIFEPSSINYEKLIKRFSSSNSINVLPYAVSNTNGNTTLYSNHPGSPLASMSKRNLDHAGIAFNYKEQIKSIRFEDYWIEELFSREVDIVKIDIEGNEYRALQGFGKAISFIKVVQFEFGGTDIDTRTFFKDFWTFFQKYEFKLFRITPLGLEPIYRYHEKEESFLFTNYIAINSMTSSGL